jgi:hypothetical protein
MDDRMIQRLEEQLRDSHATNADLRERLAESEDRARVAGITATRGREALEQLEKAHAKQRKQYDAEREALKLRGRNEELEAQPSRAQAEADQFAGLNARIEMSKHARDLFAS